MNEVGAFFGIIASVVALAWLARKAALELDALGLRGGLVGALVVLLPPVGLALWLALRSGPQRSSHPD